MPPDLLNEREFELINIIGADLASNQRDLSRHLDISLGMTNILIRRLIAKGYIRIRQLNKRKVEYILTPKGFAEKMRKSVKYTVKTLNSINLIKEQIRKIIAPYYEKGERNFYVFGQSDIALLIEMVLKEMPLDGCKVTYIKELPQTKLEGLVLLCKEDMAGENTSINSCVDLIQELAKSAYWG